MKDIDISCSPFHRLLGVTLVHSSDGCAELCLPLREELLRIDGLDWMHGGVIASLIDIAANAAVYSAVKRIVATIDLRVDYLLPSRGELRARAKTVRAGRTLAVADVEVEDSTGRITAAGRALFSIPAEEATP